MDVHRPRGPIDGPTLDVRLTGVRPIARDTNLYEFRALDGSPLPPAEAGAHIDLHLPNGMTRQYSLVAAGNQPDCYLLGIKRDPNTRGGSQWIFDQLGKGQVLTIGLPRNHFQLAQEAGYSVLVAGGIGITPIRAMLWQLDAQKSPCELHYACRTRTDMAFLDELEPLPYVHLHCDEDQGTMLDIASIVTNAPSDAHFYCCGPAPMLAAFQAAAAAIPPEQIHFEYFSARDERSLEGGFIVELARSGGEFNIRPGQSILDALREAGIDVDSSCQEGICGVCETRVISGEPDHRDSILSEDEHQSNRSMMICCSGCKGSRLILDL